MSTFFGSSLPSCVEEGSTYDITASGMNGRVVNIYGNVTIDESLPECDGSIVSLPCKHTVDCDLD